MDKYKDIISLACEKNIVIYDSLDIQHEITDRLLYLITQIFGHYTTIICRDSKLPYFRKRSLFKGVREMEWDAVEDYFLNDLGGTFAPKDKNLMLVINEDEKFYQLEKIPPAERTRSQTDDLKRRLTLASF